MLLAAPGTGKTTGIKSMIDAEYTGAERILVLSFTNATVKDLSESFKGYEYVECHTLHKYALSIGPAIDRYVLHGKEEEGPIKRLADAIDVDFEFICEKLGCITFDAMIAECAAFLSANPVYGRDKVGEVDLLIVDEYQDFNQAERELVEVITVLAKESIILGDDDQSIYGFKDADPNGIIDLYNRGDVAKMDHHHRCFRCPDEVVRRATNLIKRNRNRIEKPWWATGLPGGVAVNQCRTQRGRDKYIIDVINAARRKAEEQGAKPVSILILSPMKLCIETLPESLAENGIEFADFWAPGISVEDIRCVWKLRAIYSVRRLLSLVLLMGELSSHYKKKFKAVMSAGFQSGFDEAELLGQVEPMFKAVFDNRLSVPPEVAAISDVIAEAEHLIEYIDKEDVQGSLELILREMSPEMQFQQTAVNLMSIHKSKGLEADLVIIVGLVDGILPNGDKGSDTIESQRRLLYVGMSRAKKALHLLSTVEWEGRHVNRVGKEQFDFNPIKRVYMGRASRFLGEFESQRE